MANLPKIIRKSMPAVVSIVISKKLEEVEKEFPIQNFMPLAPFDKPEFKIPEDQVDARGMVQIGGGSGFIVESDGIILTNKHVLADGNVEYTVITTDGKKYQAEIIARDPVDDIAILKIPVKNLPTISLGDSSTLELGETVAAIGNSLGLFRNTVSAGIISGLSRSITAKPDGKSPIQELRGLIQTDAAINPGNSGGPLINLKGKVVGINAAIISGAQNIGLAIPINAAKRDLSDIKKYGRVRRPLLGLRYITIDQNMQAKMGLPVSTGALITGHGPHMEAVIPDTPAAHAGIAEKDIIIACNGIPLTDSKTIQDFLEELNVGDVLHLTVLRGEQELKIDVTLGERK